MRFMIEAGEREIDGDIFDAFFNLRNIGALAAVWLPKLEKGVMGSRLREVELDWEVVRSVENAITRNSYGYIGIVLC